jgi:Helix-turn-helix domain
MLLIRPKELGGARDQSGTDDDPGQPRPGRQ